jgi:hypothetical protein
MTHVDAMQDVMDNEAERMLWEVGRIFEHPPYFHAGKGGDTRLTQALRLCTDDKITPNSDGSYQVEGSAGRSYRVAESCSCPNSQKGSSRWCYHAVGVALYVEWQRRLRPMAPVALGTLRPGTLPLPPVTVDERLAQAPTLEERQRNYTQASLPPTAEDDDPQFVMPTTPQEDRMADDQYIPEPEEEHVSTAVLEPPMATPPADVKIPREFTVTIKGKMHVLYTGLVVAARANGLVTLSADWTYNDAELSLAHAVCTFADGRRYEESGDASPANVSKGISLHFRRVALTRAKARCLRDALGISECSVEEMAEDAGKPPVPDLTKPSDKEIRRQIWQIVRQRAPEATSRVAVEAWVKQQTSLDLHPDTYAECLRRLEGQP